MIQLLLADDHTLVREGLKRLFHSSGVIQVAGEAACSGEVLNLLRHQRFDIVLLDISMPGMGAEELLDRLRTHYPSLPVLILSMHNEPQIAKRKLKAGASGYLTKDSEPEMLLEAIQRVVKGGRYLSPELAERIAFEADRIDDDDSNTRLSNREMQVLRLLAQGLSQNEIATRLVISNKTVSTHKTRLMRKMDIGSNAELIRYAVDTGIVE
ncbi:DNA-binding response regulator, LuxR family, near polyamine transporter [Marinobacterium lacunae]|uniref:DNA-binding response regulator, LuxR family, near polyamine transporter n=1 Tax=Marinobacterium lacunae TaxID=1232683 RepID=A0A081G2V6_9GAMM|nr:response regulator transcription factor [Marinobacterium lacunae]KEA65111.1 DNA-binding response regulator, LuxR family, near polyamine transporter [Marinobacterium lacunae]